MASLLSNKFKINGVISTDKNVMQNLETLCSAAGAWLTFDIHTGRWSVIINRAGSSKYTFNDENIIGNIDISGTGIAELYNSVRVEFPHIDLNDELDFVNIEIPDSDRNPSEQDNTLNIQFDCFNDPVQAELIGFRELKQSRVDKIIRFRTDFSVLGIKAGDIIDVTNDVYNFDAKKFRVVTVEEDDSDNNAITLSITALEYDESVYNTDDLSRYERSNSNGIITIGDIGVPGAPYVALFNNNSQPRFVVEAYSPSGIVEAMEFWYYSVPESELPYWQTADDTTRTYIKHSTIYASASSNSVFPYGEFIANTITDLGAGPMLFKVRGINSTTAGPFSDPGALVEWNPVQITDAIGPNTDVLDDNWNSILGLLGANGLLALLKALMEDNAQGSGSIFDKLRALGLMNGQDVSDMFNNPDFINSLVNQNGFQVVVDAFKVNALLFNGDAQDHTVSLGKTTVIPASGRFKIRYFINWGGDGSPSSWGVFKNSTILIKKNGVPVVLGDWAATGDIHVQLYEDHQVEGFFDAIAGDVITYHFTYATNWPTAWTPPPYTDNNYVAGTYAAGWIVAELLRIPPKI